MVHQLVSLTDLTPLRPLSGVKAATGTSCSTLFLSLGLLLRHVGVEGALLGLFHVRLTLLMLLPLLFLDEPGFTTCVHTFIEALRVAHTELGRFCP